MAFSQLVKNGNFVNSEVWNLDSGTVIADNKVTITVVAGAFQGIDQEFSLVDGKQYRLTARVNGTAGKAMRFTDNGAQTGGLTSTTGGKVTFTGADQDVDITWTANENSLGLWCSRQVGGDYVFTIENIIVSKLSPFNDIIKPVDVPTPIFNDIIRTYAGEEPWHLK